MADLSQYIVKDSRGRDACVDNSPSEGGTNGLKLFANAGLDDIRGTREIQDLGTAFIIMNGVDDATWAAFAMDERIIVREGNDWTILKRDVENRPWQAASLQVPISKSCTLTFTQL